MQNASCELRSSLWTMTSTCHLQGVGPLKLHYRFKVAIVEGLFLTRWHRILWGLTPRGMHLVIVDAVQIIPAVRGAQGLQASLLFILTRSSPYLDSQFLSAYLDSLTLASKCQHKCTHSQNNRVMADCSWTYGPQGLLWMARTLLRASNLQRYLF